MPGAGICVALSGGLDSSVLLHVLARSGVRPLRAVYVDHQLHPDASGLGAALRSACARISVCPSTAERVTVDSGSGEGLEAAARRARYRALSGLLAPGEVLVTAHHQDDQAETVLLNLMRGSGVAGLAGIPRRVPLGGGRGPAPAARPAARRTSRLMRTGRRLPGSRTRPMRMTAWIGISFATRSCRRSQPAGRACTRPSRAARVCAPRPPGCSMSWRHGMRGGRNAPAGCRSPP